MANNSMIAGDQPLMPFTCNDATGSPHDLTGATSCEAHFPLANGKELVVSGSAITLSNQATNKGQFTVDFAGVDTTGLKIAKNLSVRFKAIQSARQINFKGIALDVDSGSVV